MINNLHTQRLVLMPINIGYCTSRYLSWMNDADVIKYLEIPGEYDLELLLKYIQEHVQRKAYFWGIHLKVSGKHIGNIKIDPINYKHGYAEYGILMGDKAEWGKGFAKEASSAVIQFCFETLGIRKINLGVVEDNKSAIKLYEKLGFEVEGRLKQHGFYDGKLCNMLRMAIFKNANP